MTKTPGQHREAQVKKQNNNKKKQNKEKDNILIIFMTVFKHKDILVHVLIYFEVLPLFF